MSATKFCEVEDFHPMTESAWNMLTGMFDDEVDAEGAVSKLRKRADANDYNALWILGLCHEFGVGCEKNLEEADALYAKSVEEGSAVGEFLVQNRKKQEDKGEGSLVSYGSFPSAKTVQLETFSFLHFLE